MFIAPTDIKTTFVKDTHTYCKLKISPLPRGYGITLGSAMRHALLSHLSGCAAAAIKIDGVTPEADIIEGVKENVLDIILNVKEIRPVLHEDLNKKVAQIDAVGPCHIYAFNIQDDELTVQNPSQKIATVQAGAHLRMEIQFELGRGYMPAQQSTCPGIIPIDATFTPVKRVNYYVEPARVGDVTDFDELTLEIWTDGTMSARDAVALSAENIRQNLVVFTTITTEAQG